MFILLVMLVIGEMFWRFWIFGPAVFIFRLFEYWLVVIGVVLGCEV